MGSGPSVQIVMLGLESTGKTTLLYRLKFQQYTSAIPTIGFNCEKVEVTEGVAKGVTFTFWDIGGRSISGGSKHSRPDISHASLELCGMAEDTP